MIDQKITDVANRLFNFLQPYCVAIYLGGSYCKPHINNPTDIDLIIFSEKPVDMCNIKRMIYFFLKKEENQNLQEQGFDFIQIRNTMNEEHSYGSYVNRQMIKLVGKDVYFTFDILGANKEEYISILKDTLQKIQSGKIKNKKRYYQLLEGYYYLENNSYELTEDQIDSINILHDMDEDFSEIINQIIDSLIISINNL